MVNPEYDYHMRVLLEELMHQINTIHFDMGGNNRYSLGIKAHKIIDKIKGIIYRGEEN